LVTYNEICTAIIERKVKLFGSEFALERARKAGVEVDGHGVATNADKDKLGKLVDEYRAFGGSVGMMFIRSVVDKMVKENEIDLPANLH
jgi:hypothetical protein